MSYEPEKFRPMWKQLGLAIGPDGEPYCNFSNIRLILEKAPSLRGLFMPDSSRNRVIFGNSKGAERPWSRANDLDLTIYLQREFGMAKVSRTKVAKMVQHLAFQMPPSSTARAMNNEAEEV